MTTASLLSKTRYSPPAACKPWLIARGNPRFSALAVAMTVTGTVAASRTPSRYSPVPSVEPLSTTISSQAGRVWRNNAWRQIWVNARWFQQGTMIEVKPPLIDLLMDVPGPGFDAS